MISVLLPTYNGEKYLDLSIESVLNQTFTNFELLIGFNGTTDNSKEIPYRYNDPRIKVFDYGDDKGKSKTLNKLLKEAKYDLIALQDDDDFWIHTKLEKQIPLVDKYDVIGTLISYIDKDGNIIGYPRLSTFYKDIKNKSMCGDNQVANTSTLFKKSDAFDVNGWRDGIDGIEDFDFWLRLMRIGKTFTNVPDKLVLHRLHQNSNFNTKNYDISKIL